MHAYTHISLHLIALQCTAMRCLWLHCITDCTYTCICVYIYIYIHSYSYLLISFSSLPFFFPRLSLSRSKENAYKDVDGSVQTYSFYRRSMRSRFCITSSQGVIFQTFFVSIVTCHSFFHARPTFVLPKLGSFVDSGHIARVEKV